MPHRVRDTEVVAEEVKRTDHYLRDGVFFPDGGGFFAGAGAGLSGSGIFPRLTIWMRRLVAEGGRAASRSCSSPSPSVCRRFGDILKVVTSTSRIASARRWLTIRLWSRLPPDSVWPTIRNLYGSSAGSVSVSAMRPSVR